MRSAISALSLLAIGLCILPSQDVLAFDAIKPTVSQWVQAAETGLFECQVVVPTDNGKSVALANARVEIKGANKRKAVAFTDEHGIARLPGISPGDYTLSVWSESYVGWQALHFIASDDDRFGTLPNQALVTPANISSDLFFKMASPYVAAIPELTNQADHTGETIESEDNKTLHTVKGVQVPELILRDGSVEGHLVATLKTDDIKQKDYSFEPVENTLVFIVDQQLRIHQTVTDEEGYFFIENATSGLQSIIVVGRNGIAASCLMIVDPTLTTQVTTTDGKQFVTDLEPDSTFSLEIAKEYDERGLNSNEDGMLILPEGTSGGNTGNLIGASLLGTAAVIGTSSYTTATADSEGTDPGGA